MKKNGILILAWLLSFCPFFTYGQDYFLAPYGPFDNSIPSPEQYLGYEIGAYHTRHDRIVAYFQELARLSDKATITQYGQSHEQRPLVILTITSPFNHQNLDQIQANHLNVCDPSQNVSDFSNLPIFVNLGYNVHGNEPSASESALLAAYTLIASQNSEITSYLDKAVIFIDPTLNPDGRDRHTQWVNTYRANHLVDDPADAEHNEFWPRGRTNHYWFDLNRDWLLGIHPESRGKLNWYHQWYPNVVTDVHEMGSAQTYFFEPMKDNGSLDPIMPKENYTTLNELFATYYSKALDDIGSFYFTKELFDGTYPGYGSSYPDLQGGLAILFEQASARGHVQTTATAPLTFPFAIRNQYVTGLATVKASVENKDQLYQYQKDFFSSATSRARASAVKAYVFGDPYDKNRNQGFIDKLLLHQIKVYKLNQTISRGGKTFEPDYAYVVPTNQAQYRMVQTMFETYQTYQDSVFYDASAWSLVNAYNMPYAELNGNLNLGEEITVESNQVKVPSFAQSAYAYVVPWEDYFSPALLYALQKEGVVLTSAFKPFSISINDSPKSFGYGALVIPVNSRQKMAPDELYELLKNVSQKFQVPVYPVTTGYSSAGIDLGSPYLQALRQPKAVLLIGNGVSSYEAGEVWHLLDTRIEMPISKVHMYRFNQLNLNNYNTLVMVSGSYNQLDSTHRERIKNWVAQGNTLITIRGGSSWAIRNNIVKEALIEAEKLKEDAPVQRLPYVNAPEYQGRNAVGGTIFEVDVDITHPLGFGYRRSKLPVYRNSTVWIAPSKNSYSTVAKYSNDPLIDGFITDKNLNEFLKPSASLIVSKVGRGRVVLFADNPNFRGTWWGSNRLFLNALFLGNHINVPGN